MEHEEEGNQGRGEEGVRALIHYAVAFGDAFQVS